ncbi:MAG: response regulator transcription factor [Acidobacteriaceae bacterium]
MQKLRILIVDDEPQITRVLRTSLTVQGYDVKTADDAFGAVALMENEAFDLIITDLAMPHLTGIDLCRKIREKSQVPIIVLSVRGEEKTKVEALDAGADDYVTKPFGIDELMARVRAHLRRVPLVNPASNIAEIQVGDFRIDQQSRMVFVRGAEVRLTPKEFDLLNYMAKHPQKVLTHRALLASVWGGQSVEQAEYLRTFVAQLRRKIEPEETPRYILTEPWVGYRFVPDGTW